jgi:adapter protein MecA 1/2
MKIEKINDNQIRCTLTKEDLLSREIKLSELAYGTEKAKALFRDMMQQAAYEFGFEANDIPLMIEAIPLSPDSIILIITKVEDPEELDTRFSKFTQQQPGDAAMNNSPISSKLEGADDILGLFNKIREAKKKAMEQYNSEKGQTSKPVKDNPETDNSAFNLTRLYRFPDLDTVIRAAHVLEGHYDGENSLFKDPLTREYHLIISKSGHTPEEFNKICNILSEYATNRKYVPTMRAFYKEHMECIIPDLALQKLGTLA